MADMTTPSRPSAPTRPQFQEDDEDFGALLDQHLPKAAPKTEGELLDATVVGIGREEVMVTYGSKEEIAIPIEEFRPPGGEISVRVGDSIRVLLAGFDEDGEPHLSYKQARAAAAATMLREAAEKNVPVRGTVARAVNGGLIVDVGIPAFLPQSQIDLFRGTGENASLIGQEIEAYVLEFDPQKGRAVLSRRKLLAERQDKARQAVLGQLEPGSTVTATVRDVLDFGAFVTLGDGVEGMVPRSELTYDRGVAPSEVFKVGQTVELKVLEVSADTGRITLSRKRVGEDPWATIDTQYPVGTTVTGTVKSIQAFGAFVQLQEGISGLLHAKDVSWEAERTTPESRFKIGDTVTCQVAEIDKEKKRLSLSLKSLSRDPWLDVADKYKVGTRHKGTVRYLKDFGAFVRLDEFTEGLLHVGDLEWNKRFRTAGDVLKEGQEVEVIVLGHDAARRRISLGVKQLTGSPLEKFLAEHPVGSLATGKVSRIMPFGAFVELLPNLEGLIHISELDDNRVDSVERVVRIGEEVQVKVISVDQEKSKIALSRKEAIHEAERDNIRQYGKQEETTAPTSPFAAAMAEAQRKREGKGKK